MPNLKRGYPLLPVSVIQDTTVADVSDVLSLWLAHLALEKVAELSPIVLLCSSVHTAEVKSQDLQAWRCTLSSRFPCRWSEASGPASLEVWVFIFGVLCWVLPHQEKGLGVISAIGGRDQTQGLLATPL